MGALVVDTRGRYKQPPRTLRHIDGLNELPGDAIVLAVEIAEAEATVQRRRDIDPGIVEELVRRTSVEGPEDVGRVVVLVPRRRTSVLDLSVAGCAVGADEPNPPVLQVGEVLVRAMTGVPRVFGPGDHRAPRRESGRVVEIVERQIEIEGVLTGRDTRGKEPVGGGARLRCALAR